MKHLFTAFFIIVLFYGCNEKNQGKIDNDKVRVNNVCDEIMRHFQTGKIAEVSNLLKANSSLIGKASIDTLQQQIISQFESGDFSQYGNSTSFELVKELNAGDFASKRYYALKFERFF